MADVPIVEWAKDRYYTSEYCDHCRKVRTWHKDKVGPWHCTRCRRQAAINTRLAMASTASQQEADQQEADRQEADVNIEAYLLEIEAVLPVVVAGSSVGYCGRCGAPAYFDKNPCRRCGAPVWGPWIGVEGPPGEVPIPCPFCKHVDMVPARSRTHICAACKSTLSFAACGRCGRGNQVPLGGSDTYKCAYCKRWVKVCPATAEAYFVDIVTSASWVPTIDRDMRWLDDCLVLAAAGVEYSAGANCVLQFGSEGMGMIQTLGKRTTSWTYSEIQTLQLGGPGMVQTETGGGFIGGGFGVAGAVGGMLAAAALNALTTRKKTSITTLIVLKTATSEIVFLNQQVTPEKLQLDLTPVFLRLRMAHAAAAEAPALPAPDVPTDPVARLRELAALVKEGILTDEEFQEAKKRILEDIK